MSYSRSLWERLRQLVGIAKVADQPADSSSMSPFRFDDLPAELKLNVLSNLPAKEVQQARQVSKDTRDLIDLKGNRSMLVTEASRMALAAIQHHHDNIINFDPVNTDPLQLLRRVVRLRKGFYSSNSDVAAIWAHRYGLDAWETRRLSCVLQSLVALNCLHNPKDRKTPNDRELGPRGPEWLLSESQFMAHYGHYTMDWIWDHPERTGLSRAMLQDMYIRVSENDELSLAGVRRHREVWLAGVPRYYDLPFGFDYRIREICDMLNLPRIPIHLIEHVRISVRSQWAHDKVMAMLEDGEKATDLQVMAIKEELFLY